MIENVNEVIEVDVITLKAKQVTSSKVVQVGTVIRTQEMKLGHLDSYFRRLTMFLSQRQNIANATRLPKAELPMFQEGSEYGLNKNGFLEKGGAFYYDKNLNLQERKAPKSPKESK